MVITRTLATVTITKVRVIRNLIKIYFLLRNMEKKWTEHHYRIAEEFEKKFSIHTPDQVKIFNP